MRRLTALSFLIAGAMGSVVAIDGKRVNGYVVSEHWRNGWTQTCCDCNLKLMAGDIDLFTLRDGAVVKKDTIYDAKDGMAICPTFDISGTQVAFYRHGKGITVNANGGTSCVTVNGGVSYVSVTSRDGTGLRNLVALRTAPWDEVMLAWPAGEWVYYLNPRTDMWSGRSTEVRKVNVRTLQDLFVWQDGNSSNWFRRFTLSVDAARIGAQNTPSGFNAVASFPDMRVICSMVACNGAVSPSGLFGASYFGGAHTELFISRADGCSGYASFALFSSSSSISPNFLGNVEAWSGRDLFSGSEGCELIRWAVNSDKWILQTVGWWGHAGEIGQGANSVAANIADKAAFMVSDNPRIPKLQDAPDLIHYGNSTGSMWIDGGPENAGKWEGVDGVWHAIPGYDPTAVLDGLRSGLSSAPTIVCSYDAITLPGRGACQCRIIDARGRCVLLHEGFGTAVLSTDALRSGTYLVRATREGAASQSRLVVTR